MSRLKESLGGIFPRLTEARQPTTQVIKLDLGMDARNIRLKVSDSLLTSNHRLKDIGLRLQVGTDRTRRGNRKR